MYGNVGEMWIQIKDLALENMQLNECGNEFEIQDYHSVPHGYASIKYGGVLLFIPDDVFKKHFVRLSEYKQYYHLGDQIMINANGNLSTYTIEHIKGDGHYVTLELEQS